MKIFRTHTFALALIAVLSLSLGACVEEQGPAEELGEKLDEAVDELKDGGDDIGDQLEDAGDEIKEAAEEVKDEIDGDGS